MIGPVYNSHRRLVETGCPSQTRSMWYAICSKKDCGWDHAAISRVSAMVYADTHSWACYPDLTHRVWIVDIPDASMPSDAAPDPR